MAIIVGSVETGGSWSHEATGLTAGAVVGGSWLTEGRSVIVEAVGNGKASSTGASSISSSSLSLIVSRREAVTAAKLGLNLRQRSDSSCPTFRHALQYGASHWNFLWPRILHRRQRGGRPATFIRAWPFKPSNSQAMRSGMTSRLSHSTTMLRTFVLQLDSLSFSVKALITVTPTFSNCWVITEVGT